MAQAYRELKTVTGNFARVQIFPVRPYQYGRKKKMKPTGAAMAKVNRENRARRLADLLNLNFTKNDIQLKLDYSSFKAEHGRNPEPNEIVRYMQNFMRRVKRLYKSLGIELKYVYCSEVGSRGRISHHHVVINKGATYEQLRALWQEGGIWMRKLYFDKKGCYDLASYFVKSRYTYRTYCCSRNLIRPQETGRDKSIYKNDYNVRQKHVNHILGDPGDLEYIRRIYPDWCVAEVPDIAMTLDRDTGEAKLPTWGVFITIYLYKPDGLSEKNSFAYKEGKHEKSQTA